ncbi:MAG TPA: M14 metallopeptidase family protein [Gemmatimonas sp.]|uniref:M14 family metallopeptidase n=1 Tax=Gemmatimonas sp. TaxID=1962908 RepID=UPI002EDB14F1
MRRIFAPLTTLSLASLLCAAPPLHAQTQGRITTPKEAFGANYGDDYFLANYQQISNYWRTLEKESPRVKLRVMGKTAEGRDQLMAIITSPENHRNLERYRQIAERLARAEGLTDDQARALAKEGKAIVWIDGGLHATETLGAQQLGETVYQMASGTDPETMRFLDDVIMLFVHANPDGNDLVADWYMRTSDPKERTLTGLPRLYQKYIGHDNNREFFTSTQKETENINRALYHTWFPQLLYNHHQSGPAGTVVYSPPFRDPYNYNLDPAMLLGIQALGTAMHTRLAIEGKPGATMRNGASYDGWWNGGIRNTATFHNTIAVLTEMIGGPTPMRIPLIAERQIPRGDMAMPVAPQMWHLRQSVDYSVSLNRAVLDHASRLRENLLFNIYRMGKNSIERGNRDTWTPNPRRDAEVAKRVKGADSLIWAAQHAPEYRDPRGYIIPSDQPDFLTAIKFINGLRETGITVQRATAAFTVNGKSYPAGSFVVQTAQAFRPHVIDMFEPQVHPDVFPYPGSPPTPPYDNAGWTWAYQMGIRFDRLLEPFSGPFTAVTDWNVAPPAGTVSAGAKGYWIDPRVNDAFTVVNRLLAAKVPVARATQAVTAGAATLPAGAFWVPSGGAAANVLRTAATELGVSATGAASAPSSTTPLRAARIGLWDTYGGSMPSGWTRWILEQFAYPFSRVFAPDIDAGNLRAKYDALVFVEGAIPGVQAAGRGGGSGGVLDEPPNLPAEFKGQFGRMSVDKSLPSLKAFIEQGGTVVAIGNSAVNLAAYLQLPVGNHLAKDGTPYPRTQFYVPGSVLRIKVDTTSSAAFGMPGQADVFFDASPVFTLGADAASRGVRPIAWFEGTSPLRSGWAWGQELLDKGVAGVEAKVGQGRVLLYGPQITQRAQPHGTFKLLFNGLYR